MSRAGASLSGVMPLQCLQARTAAVNTCVRARPGHPTGVSHELDCCTTLEPVVTVGSCGVWLSRLCGVGWEPGLASGCVGVRLTGQGVVGDARVRMACSHLVAALQAKGLTHTVTGPATCSHTHTRSSYGQHPPTLACVRPALICESRPHVHQDHAPTPPHLPLPPTKDGGVLDRAHPPESGVPAVATHIHLTPNSPLFSRCDHNSVSAPTQATLNMSRHGLFTR